MLNSLSIITHPVVWSNNTYKFSLNIVIDFGSIKSNREKRRINLQYTIFLLSLNYHEFLRFIILGFAIAISTFADSKITFS